MWDFLKYQFSHVFSNRLLQQMKSHISCICEIFPNVTLHISSQIACLNRCKVTIVAEMRNFAIRWYQTSSQVIWLNRYKVTIVACVGFSQMSVFTCLLKLAASTDEKSHSLHMCNFPKCYITHALLGNYYKKKRAGNIVIENLKLFWNIRYTMVWDLRRKCQLIWALQNKVVLVKKMWSNVETSACVI